MAPENSIFHKRHSKTLLCLETMAHVLKYTQAVCELLDFDISAACFIRSLQGLLAALATPTANFPSIHLFMEHMVGGITQLTDVSL